MEDFFNNPLSAFLTVSVLFNVVLIYANSKNAQFFLRTEADYTNRINDIVKGYQKELHEQEVTIIRLRRKSLFYRAINFGLLHQLKGIK